MRVTDKYNKQELHGPEYPGKTILLALKTCFYNLTNAGLKH